MNSTANYKKKRKRKNPLNFHGMLKKYTKTGIPNHAQQQKFFCEKSLQKLN